MTAELAIVADTAPPVAVPGLSLPPLHERWTREGRCMFREAAVPLPSDHWFRAAWKRSKREWMARGFSLRQMNGSWWLQQWLKVHDDGALTLTPIGQQRLDELTAPRELPLAQEPVVVTCPDLPPGVVAKLYDYQVDGARQILRALREGPKEWGYAGAWDASDLGTGKTFQSLAAAIATGLEVGVVCPLAVIPAWKNAFMHFGQCPRFIRNYESLRTGNRDYVKVENYSRPDGKKGRRFAWQLDPEQTLLIFDEAHNMKNPGTRNEALGIAALRQGFPMILVSGTLATDPTNMRVAGRAVGLHQGGKSWEEFLASHNCEGRGNNWKFRGGRTGLARLASIHHRVFPARGARIRIADLGDRFPETQTMAEPFDTGETQAIAKAFREAEEVIEKLRSQGVNEWEIKVRRASAYMEAWHESERCKVHAIADMVKSEIDEGRSVAVFVNFTDVRTALMDRLKTSCAIYGGQNSIERQRCIEEFQSDRSRVIVANIDAGGVGVSLHDLHGNHPRTSIILPTNKVVSLTQALGRVHRAGGKSRSRQIIFFAAGTVEEQICAIIRKRMAQITTLNDGELYPEARF